MDGVDSIMNEFVAFPEEVIDINNSDKGKPDPEHKEHGIIVRVNSEPFYQVSKDQHENELLNPRDNDKLAERSSFFKLLIDALFGFPRTPHPNLTKERTVPYHTQTLRDDDREDDSDPIDRCCGNSHVLICVSEWLRCFMKDF